MSKLSENVRRKVAQLQVRHEGLKKKSYGFLVRPLTLLAGWLFVVGGILIIPTPGPGWFLLFFGIGVLSFELTWPNRLLDYGLRQYDRAEEYWKRQGTAMKSLIIVVFLVGCAIVFSGIFWVMWNTGMLGFTKTWLEPWVDKLPDWIGLK
ncbi:TIGR02611 family protein [Corynebacterium macclintockiae]|uniref:TIGR02611 family protein n=1 Tax=Corynebacterium macclintockiae TaxID=2913501 RepID=A0A9X3RQP6_9CORY|nr:MULTISPECIES: TIGR02611 family protein [Corynebacterium]MBC6794723.1 TIGR02611 family protein [Corynebacterium sp. LK28]MCZ9305555.1 TIGR02611 family protein [Corynebacterium macclintockiae]MDK8870265.1 TIGR02611 family protein [Corynebacterium macclintockiae]OFM55277.1 hypothetical protein HMPREF2678_01865 [Corynebacterium sp. HMSC058E07]